MHSILQNAAKKQLYLSLRNSTTSAIEIAFQAKKILVDFTEEEQKQVIAQIAAYQKALKKLPDWCANENIILPPTVSIEQASSQQAAQLKANLFAGKNCTDLTGGTGIDTYYLAQTFQQTHYVEPQQHLCNIASHNFEQLPKSNAITCHCSDAATFLQQLTEVQDLIYIDPSRRTEQNHKIITLAESSPNVIELQTIIAQKAKKCVIKASPMIDIKQSLQQLNYVERVYTIAIENELKEVLFEINYEKKATQTQFVAIDLGKNETEMNVQNAVCFLEDEYRTGVQLGEVQHYLYEPSVAILKAGGFKWVAQHYELHKLHIHTHFYTNQQLIPHFLGRIFEVIQVVKYNKKEVLAVLPQPKANIIARNFPDSPERIAKKLGVKSSGDWYILAATCLKEQKKLIIAKRIK